MRAHADINTFTSHQSQIISHLSGLLSRYVGSYFGGWVWTLLLTLPHSLAVNLAFPAIAVNDNVYGCARTSSVPACPASD